MDLRLSFLLYLLVLFVLILFGTVGFAQIEGWDLFSGLYMTIITISTVGYGEIEPLSDAGRLFAIVLIIGGILTFSVGISFLTSSLVEIKFDDLVKARRRERRIMKLTGHQIICGAGRVGSEVMSDLVHRSIPFVLIDYDLETIRQMEANFGEIHYVVGNAASEEVLLKAGIERAAGLVAALPNDAENLFICLAARELNRGLRIVVRAEYEENVARMKKAGADNVISPAQTGAHRMVAMLLEPSVVDFLDTVTRLGTHELRLEEFQIGADSPLCNRTLGESRIPQETGLIVIAIRKPPPLVDFNFNPRASTRLEDQDRIVVLGEDDQIEKLRQLNSI